jgi:hypothetical protein
VFHLDDTVTLCCEINTTCNAIDGELSNEIKISLYVNRYLVNEYIREIQDSVHGKYFMMFGNRYYIPQEDEGS